jgi:hypothetical protein
LGNKVLPDFAHTGLPNRLSPSKLSITIPSIFSPSSLVLSYPILSTIARLTVSGTLFRSILSSLPGQVSVFLVVSDPYAPPHAVNSAIRSSF